MSDAPVTAEQLFGRKTGRHTHPATHPLWMEFADGDCIVCAGFRKEGRDGQRVRVEQGRNAGMASAATPLTAVVPGQPVNGDTYTALLSKRQED